MFWNWSSTLPFFRSGVLLFWYAQLYIRWRAFIFWKPDPTRGPGNGNLKIFKSKIVPSVWFWICKFMSLFSEYFKCSTEGTCTSFIRSTLGKKYQNILIIHQGQILVAESPVYNRHFKALKVCFVLFPPPPKCTVLSKQNILAAFITVNYYSRSSGEMFLSQEQCFQNIVNF